MDTADGDSGGAPRALRPSFDGLPLMLYALSRPATPKRPKHL